MDANKFSTGPLAGLPAVCHQLLEAKAAKGLSFEQISKELGKPEVWTAAIFYGQASVSDSSIIVFFSCRKPLPRLGQSNTERRTYVSSPILRPGRPRYPRETLLPSRRSTL